MTLTRRWLLHGSLFVLTFLLASWIQSPVYAVSIMGILLAHELGHYFMCRRYGVAASFPLFIPMPNILGTLGAIIAMRSPIPHRKALFDIGIAGPLAGMAVALPAVALGLHLSEIVQVANLEGALQLGEPLLFRWLALWIKGPLPPGTDISLHPIAFAGWAVFFVTAINLFPAGQLDGGHIVYAMLGPRHARRAYWLIVAVLIFLGLRFHPMWFIFVSLILILMFRHPPTLDDRTPIDPKRRFWGFFAFLLMILCFTPVPFHFSQ